MERIPTEGVEPMTDKPTVNKSSTAIAELQDRMNQGIPLPAPVAQEPEVSWKDLTWWEKRQRAATIVAMHREGIRAHRLRNRAERFLQRQNEVLSWFGQTNQLRILDVQTGGLVDVINGGAIKDGWVISNDGRRVKKAPHLTLYLKRPLKAGPVTIYPPGSPLAINELEIGGLTDEMLLALPGGGLRNALQAGNRDAFALGKTGKWLLIGLVAIGIVAGAVWLYARGVFG
jgi:hypothetical protein